MAVVPSTIASSLQETAGGIGDIFTNVQDVVQTVGSIYDQITGKDEGLPQAAVTAPAPAPAPAPAAAPSMSTQTK